MLDFISATPPETAVLLGLFMGLSLKRSRIGALIDHYLPVTKNDRGATIVETPDEDPRTDG